MQTAKETLGERLKRSRKEAQLSQEAVADAAGISASAISQIENGVSQTMAAENIFPIARLLRKNPEWLLTGEGPEMDMQEIGMAISELPNDSPQQSLDFLEYRWQKAEGLVASEKISHYTAMIESFKKDLARRKAE